MSLGYTPKQVAGRNISLFETYYLSLDPTGKGQVGAMDAAKFLKRSGLSDAILSKIWDLSDPNGKGYLDKLGVFVALKLVAFAQNGREVSLATVLDEFIPEPEMSSGRGAPPIPMTNQHQSSKSPQPPISVSPAPVGIDWSINNSDMIKYKQLFVNLGAEGGKLAGAKAKSVLIDSKLPVDTLGKIWDLADMDKDGSLSETEFVLAMHLVYKCLEKYPVPSMIPPELQKFVLSHQQPVGVVAPILPTSTSLPRKPSLTFDNPPLLSSVSALPPTAIVPTPQPSIIPSPIPMLPVKDNWIIPYDERAKFKSLFHSTDLDHDGFVSGNEIKGVFLQSGLQQQTLAHIWNLCDFDQSGKLNADQFTLAMWLVSNGLKGIQPPSILAPEMIPPGMSVPQRAPPPSQEPELSPEFELLMKEINELTQEKLNLEMEISSKECDKKIKTGETKTLQSELDTLATTLKQLENQKNVAQGKLSELDGQVSALRFQAEEQEVKLVAQESELSTKAAELTALDKEEQGLHVEMDSCGRTIEKLGNLLQDALLQISQTKTRLCSLTEVHETMKTSITKYSSAIDSNNAYTVTEPELRDVKSELDELIGIPSPKYYNGEQQISSTLANGTNGFPTQFDAFLTPVAAPVGVSSSSWDHDPFAPVKGSTAASGDPFAPTAHHDPFARSGNVSSPQGFSNDPFGSVPFEAEVAPALPPKRAPPRPAPPKNAPARPPPPMSKAPPPKQDPFPEDHFDGGFADFSQFDNQIWGSSSKINNTTNGGNNNNNDNHYDVSSNKPVTTTTKNQPTHFKYPVLEFTEDPFKNYRYEDPFENLDPFAS